MTADFIGRRPAFNVTLLITGISGLVGAESPTFFAISLFCTVIRLRSSRNQPIDSAIFLKFTPTTHQYLLTMYSSTRSLTFGGLPLAIFFAQLFFRIHKTPKYLLGKGRDRETTELTVDHFEAVSARLQSSEPDETVSADSSPVSNNIIRRAVKA
ncbi:membrane transporter [Penicillium cosmopolitanum]|uniref:Membrane transporter n=1 Tax=Penicillium cosmopolitanum TaxID=1131564 RepID=A0A9W9VME6_9EURO|nr:membrane transporter [Penicillium cosmopolitanum]KAJ5385811.1 membrane transporter [Penicillium cosmopolitanum]